MDEAKKKDLQDVKESRDEAQNAANELDKRTEKALHPFVEAARHASYAKAGIVQCELSLKNIQEILTLEEIEEIDNISMFFSKYSRKADISIYPKTKNAQKLRLAMARLAENGKATKFVHYSQEALNVQAIDKFGTELILQYQIPPSCKVVTTKEWVEPSDKGHYREVKKIICTDEDGVETSQET